MLIRGFFGVAVAWCCLPATALAGAAPLELTPPLPLPQAQPVCGGSTALAGDVSTRRLRAATLCLMNADRAAHGLGALHPSRALRRAARRHARDMAARHYFAHDEPSGRTVLDRVRASGYLHGSGCPVGENLAVGWGAAGTPWAIENRWMDSPHHRDNILRGAYHDVGIAVMQRAGRITYVIDFGGC